MNAGRSPVVGCLLLLALVSASAQDRMPPIAKESMTKAQKQSVDELLNTPRGTGSLSGPFIPLLRSPELMNRLQRTGEYLRFQNSIGHKLTEFLILLTARQWTQQYEFAIHEPLALKAGVKQDVITAVAEGRRPVMMDDGEDIAYGFFTELRENHSISDATYARAVTRFGEQGVVDLTALIGYYTTLAMIMNVARTPLPYLVKAPLTALP